MSRSIWKGVNKRLLNNNNSNQGSTTHHDLSRINGIKIGRADMLIPEMIDKKVLVHTGNSWKTIQVKNVHIGQKAGEFAATKYPAIFKRNKRKIGRIKYGS
jgi:ribosomal protein S19